ncbi:Hydrogenase maturation protease [[Clostridium] ultunense Esp]|uniref:HyaD/HybD family hydrogenase maturation endopeptidase n=1 Tax=Thermicanus aegyptius TaxID=94009 RepID=UPI0002B6FF16|nr:HyaD/HybD family hydrogenase maturation endopeptidase [Thermicanus aegyptius]CCQ97300.1 Hydrogenase maturation protease [[Clostridium] ultunense Esp]
MVEPLRKKPMITILGIGNTLYSDEGVGVHALPLLEEAFAGYDNVELVEGSTDGIKLLGPVESADYLIVIDAINAGKEGGSLIFLYDDEIPAYYGIKMSIHQVTFQEVLFAAKLREAYPNKIVMIGVQPVSLELGVELSEKVRESLPHLVAKVKEQVDAWMKEEMLVSQKGTDRR